MTIKKSIAISDSGFVFDASSGDSYTLNPIGLEILNLIKAGNSDSAISQLMTEKYDVEQSAFERYFYDFVSTLKQMQILESHGEN